MRNPFEVLQERRAEYQQQRQARITLADQKWIDAVTTLQTHSREGIFTSEDLLNLDHAYGEHLWAHIQPEKPSLFDLILPR